MKWNIIYTLFFSLFIGVTFWNYAAGPASSVGTGNTGAPGDEMLGPFFRTCETCHGGNNITTNLEITVLNAVGDTIKEEYIPEEVYRVKVSHDVTAGDPNAYGFQIVSLFNANDTDVAAFSNPDDNTQIAIASSNDRQYAEHDGPNNNTSFFEVDWTAPQAGSGSITFYSCGNAVNLDGTNSGDGADCTTLTLQEGQTSSVVDKTLTLNHFQLYPNPVETETTLQFSPENTGNYTLAITDVTGQTHWQSEREIYTPAFRETLNLNQLSAGIYFLRIHQKQRVFTYRFIKL